MSLTPCIVIGVFLSIRGSLGNSSMGSAGLLGFAGPCNIFSTTEDFDFV